MDLREQLAELERVRSKINYLLSAPDLEETTREELQSRLEKVAELRTRWEVLRQQYERGRSHWGAP